MYVPIRSWGVSPSERTEKRLSSAASLRLRGRARPKLRGPEEGRCSAASVAERTRGGVIRPSWFFVGRWA